MTSTPVKDVGSALMNLTVSQAGKNSLGAGGFQKVWNSQMNKGTADGGVRSNAKSQSGRQVQKGSSLKAKESQTVRETGGKPAENLSSEEQEQAAEVLSAAALKLMEQIMDAFGIGAEELQAAMGELGMEQTDVLDASALGILLMRLSGAEDPYALVTDGELYEKYRMLTEALNSALSESAESLGTDSEQLLRFLEKGLAGEAAEEMSPAERIDSARENVDQTGGELTEGELTVEEAVPAVGTTEEAARKAQEAQSQAGGRQTEEKQSDGRSDRGQQINPFAQNLGTEQFRPDLQQTEGAAHSSPWSADTQEIMDQIMDYMKIRLNADSTSLEMQLHPASLGTLQVQIASRGGVLTANFITQNEAVKAALETQMIQLKEQFEEQGVKVEAIEVTVQTHEFERNLDEQGRGRSQQEPERRSRTRRINLSDPLGVETLEEGDALTAEMMAANGSTVDYIA